MPTTVFDRGCTLTWPLEGTAVTVALPAIVKVTVTERDVQRLILTDSGTVNVQAAGVGDGLGDGETVGPGTGVGVALGLGVATGTAVKSCTRAPLIIENSTSDGVNVWPARCGETITDSPVVGFRL